MVERIRVEPGVFRISKPGVDVGSASATSPDNFILHEGYQNLGVFMTGTATLAAYAEDGNGSYNGQTILYPYDLGYIPLVIAHWLLLPGEAFASYANSESWRYMEPDVETTDRGFYVWPMRDRLRCTRWGNSSLGDVTIRYTVFFAKMGDA
ncbi:hypothetical protein [Brevundimonas sp. Bb-A]|uniref:hypothetical protein n=1 Tax=Brevundimonas sp. Bb-A TaxID=2560058 RepID=UPI00128EAA7C|nr:hypothetical protein [Brevundimonas sp. Bb-A]QFU30268.1 hypothetical protein BSP_01195 [Brevundimonas sp. Bb-A]